LVYLKVEWIHDFIDEPILIYMELDYERNEIRKVEIYSNNKIGYADLNHEYAGTRLSLEPIPTIDEIVEDEQFKPVEISNEEFEKVWSEAVALS
jgi:hypothetical protein